MIVVDTMNYRTLKEKQHIIDRIRNKFGKVLFSFTENLVIYQYNDTRTDV